MKDNPTLSGGSLKSKPTWRSISQCSATSAFFAFSGTARKQAEGRMPMVDSDLIRGHFAGERIHSKQVRKSFLTRNLLVRLPTEEGDVHEPVQIGIFATITTSP